jgi:hypothetical protein
MLTAHLDTVYNSPGAANHFGNLGSLDDPGEKKVVYFSCLRLFVVSYEVVFGYI